nr:hypothetical protein [Catenulispora pinisilvae]
MQTRSKSAGVIVSSAPKCSTPAQEATTSRCPNSATVRSISAAVCPGSATSAWTAMA